MSQQAATAESNAMGTPQAASVRRFDPFRVLSREEREQHMQQYLHFLERERDGELDMGAQTLSAREAFFADLEQKPVSWGGEIDHDGFFQHFRSLGQPEIDSLTVWLVAIAKSNEGESYGVKRELDQVFARTDAGEGLERAYQHMLLQEHYHCRILLAACRACGIDIEFREPHWPQRFFIRAILHMPDSVRWIAVICGEVVGTVMFQVLREGARAFSAEPEVEERLRLLLNEIWIDEALHVAYLRAKLPPWALRIAHRLLPLVATGVLWDFPQFTSLGIDRQELMARLRRGLEIPPSVGWMPAELTGSP